jgi:hypothetical protein
MTKLGKELSEIADRNEKTLPQSRTIVSRILDYKKEIKEIAEQQQFSRKIDLTQMIYLKDISFPFYSKEIIEEEVEIMLGLKEVILDSEFLNSEEYRFSSLIIKY